ncbi:MAG: hypothetical protein IPN86_19065 [Saprospiraceae bacterium]|nr:hypothetical protein [Saprospiraceae bacterium]
MNNRIISSIYVFIAVISANLLNAQCENWIGKPTQTDAENAHSIYRQALKAGDYTTAFENWQIAYKLAPAADGKRDYHYTDGVLLYKNMLANVADEKTKAEYHAQITKLYDQAIACYQSKSITTKNGTEDELNAKIGYLYGRKAYDMFYTINASYDDNMVALDNCIKFAGDNAEYIIMDPYANIIVWEFKEGRLPKQKQLNYIKD